MINKPKSNGVSEIREKHNSVATNPLSVDFDDRRSVFLNKLTKTAVNLYERNCDVRNFTKLALSNPENQSHNEIMDELFSQGVIDPSDDEKLMELSNNSRFLRDLGLIE